jgi:hypothetical protein
MTKKLSRTVFLMAHCLLFAIVANAQTVTIDTATERLSGEKVRGPVTITLRNLNVLRYDIQVGRTVTFTAGPDLKLPFIPPIPTQQAPAAPTTGQSAVNANAVNDVQTAFEGLVIDFASLNTAFVTDVQRPINNVSLARDELEAFVSASDSILRTPGGAQSIVDGIPRVVTTIDGALAQPWPDAAIVRLLGELDSLRVRVFGLQSMPGFKDWHALAGNKTAYDELLTRITELQTTLRGLGVGSQQFNAFREVQNKLRVWRPILEGVRRGGTASFDRTFRVGCGFGFSDNRETKIEVVKRDRLAAPGTADTREEILTVVCSSPLSISGGFGFSALDEREFIFVPSTKTVTDSSGVASEVVINRFGFKNRSSFRALPVLLLNTRVWEPNDTIALHLSAGAAVDIKTGQAGTDLEFIVGPSVSFKRTLFVTTGMHVGRVPTLVGGFNIGQEVPNGISQPPIEKAYKNGFITTLTFKLR